ncbi:tetratricopeptide repeat protein [Sorangium sp. So ce861]|uniref:tetratricopeptide repeat protein n=1 Tax=Sorangium sp. So ce861 TaxID=3133323 RepID=UPI003F5E385B
MPAVRSCRQLTSGLLLGLTLLAIPATAAGQQSQPTAEAKLAARALANKGVELFDAGRYEDALTAFRGAEALVHAPPLVVMAARSCERLGRLIEARSLYQRVLDEPLAATAPRAFQEAQAEAKTELAALAPRIPTLEVALAGTAQGAVQLTLDGEHIAPATPVQRDPGEHTLVGVEPGRPPVTTKVRLDERMKRYIILDLTPPSPEATPTRSAPVASQGNRQKLLFIGGGAAAGTGIIAGTVFSILALGKGGDAENLRDSVRSDRTLNGRCPSTSPPPVCTELRDTVNLQYTFINAALYSFIVGAVGAGTVIYALVDRPAAPASRMQVVPHVGWGSAGLSLSGQF